MPSFHGRSSAPGGATPSHGAELAVLYALPHVVPEVQRRTQRRVGSTDHTVDELCRKVVRRTVLLSRRDGVLTGTSFYVGMPAAMASMYLHQLLMVLEIAALHGRDPAKPSRAAEILVVQGRYPTTGAAAEVLRALGTPRGAHLSVGLWSATVEALRQVPTIIGVKLRSARSRGALSTVISVLQVVSYLVPVLSIPACVMSSARTTRHLGHAASEYYVRAQAGDADPPIPRPPRRSRRADYVVNVSLVVSAFVVAGVSVLSVTVDHHAVRIELLVVELGVSITFVRLWWITRPERLTGEGSRT